MEQIKILSKETTKEECRDFYHIPKEKICLTCGYSAYADQHQDDCLKELMKLPKLIREKIYVIVPMQYGRFDEGYIKRVEDQAKLCDFSCMILKKYTSFENSAKLAIATDIYIHVRDTDAFSNTLKEQVYASSLIITGSWLSYLELEEMGVPLTRINGIGELSKTVEKIIPHFIPEKTIHLYEPIYEMYSTESIVTQWETVLEKALHEETS